MDERKPAALISEDTELGRWALTRALEAEAFEVTAVSTWAEASDWLRQEDFSLVLLAVSSAPGNAAEIVADIHRDYPNTHLVLLADQDSVGELRVACGPVPDILAKPLDLRSVARIAVLHSGTA
jgi:DNA-binding NtrC family response regulator